MQTGDKRISKVVIYLYKAHRTQFTYSFRKKFSIRICIYIYSKPSLLVIPIIWPIFVDEPEKISANRSKCIKRYYYRCLLYRAYPRKPYCYFCAFTKYIVAAVKKRIIHNPKQIRRFVTNDRTTRSYCIWACVYRPRNVRQIIYDANLTRCEKKILLFLHYSRVMHI